MHHIFTRKRLITFAISSFVLFIFSIILAFVILPIVIDSQIDKNVRLERGTDQWHRFEILPYNMSLNITFFEVTNVDEVIKGAKPNLKEKGPYVYDEVVTKDVSSYNENNDTFSYTKNVSFHFNKTRSGPGLSEADKVTIINPAYIAAMEATDIPIIAGALQACLGTMFLDGIPLKTATVRQILFDGVYLCNKTHPFCVTPCGLIEKFFKSKTVESTPDDNLKFSFLNYRRRAPDGIYEVNTGMSNSMEIANITNWNYADHHNIWKDPEHNNSKKNNSCNKVKGTDGTIFPPHVSEDTTITVFSTDICRTVELTYNGTGTYQGIDGFVFKPKNFFNYNTSANSSNKCFGGGTTLDVNGKNSPYMDGAMDISPCMGAPVLISYPHFLYANETYSKNITGDIKPDPEKHELYLLIDKYTGTPLSAHQRIQISLVIRPLKYHNITQNLPHAVVPLFWMDEGIDLPEDGIELLNSLLYNTLSIVNILKWIFIAVSGALTIIACILLYKHIYSP